MLPAAIQADSFVALLTLGLLVVAVLVIWLMSRGLSSWRAGLSGVDEGLMAREGHAVVDNDDYESLVEEVRQHVIAENARRERRGEEPLDVEAEVERRLLEFGA